MRGSSMAVGGVCVCVGLTACANDWRDVSGDTRLPDNGAANTTVPEWGPLVSSTRAPPAIAGGTLAISADDTAVVSDPDHDVVFVADLARNERRGTVALRSGDEPGRAVFGPAGRAFVALRASGDVAVVDTVNATLVSRIAVCAAPRGLAWTTRARLAVACAEGRFVVMDPATGHRDVDVMVTPDLRDVLDDGTGYYVSTFRGAQLLRLSETGVVESTDTPPDDPLDSVRDDGNPDGRSNVPAVAWRIVRSGPRVLMVHQRASTRVVPAVSAIPAPAPYGGSGESGCMFDGSPGIVTAAVSTFENGHPSEVLPQTIAGAVLPVDLAVATTVDDTGDRTSRQSSDGVVVIAAGNNRLPGGRQLFPAGVLCGTSHGALEPAAQTVAGAFRANGELVVLTRQPTRLYGMKSWTTLTLAEADGDDTGHAIFHSNSGNGIACASCHPEGGDDGRVWKFQLEGARRTQNFRGGVSHLAPYHWAGEMPALGDLMGEVFHRRMGGPSLDDAHVATLAHWMDTIPRLPSATVPDAMAVARGRALFESAGTQCNTCHAGDLGTDNRLADVGTGGTFATPPLAGLAYRAPYMHDGRAATLAARFDPHVGGGDAHGRTSQLTDAQRADLIAYLASR